MREHAVLYVNGERHAVPAASALQTVSDWLRYDLRLTGTKVVCAEGDCGACTVLVGRPGEEPGPWRFLPVNCCITAVAQLDGAHLITIEGVAGPDGLHEVQRAMVDHHGSQCGFCTPGFVMALLGHFEHHPDVRADEKSLKNHLTGNLCRCTGYQPILDAGCAVRPDHLESVSARHHSEAIATDLLAVRAEPLRLDVDGGRYEAPSSLSALLAARAAAPEARLISGNTDLGVLVNKGKLWPPGERRHAISLHLVPELAGIEDRGDRLTVRARATLSGLERAATGRIDELARLLRVFASPQIKNICTLVGNVANGSPIGDTIPSLVALGAELELQSVRGVRRLPIDQFYKGYKVFDLAPDEVLTSIDLPIPAASDRFRATKVCQRKDLDISYVGAAYKLAIEAGHIASARVAYGGVAATVIRLPEVEARLVGLPVGDRRGFEAAARAVEAAIEPRSDVRGSLDGRRILSGNLLRRFGAELRGEVQP